jgi:hypothetical protein
MRRRRQHEAMKTTVECRLDALQGCLVAVCAALPAEQADRARKLMAAAAAELGNEPMSADGDAACAEVFASMVFAAAVCAPEPGSLSARRYLAATEISAAA